MRDEPNVGLRCLTARASETTNGVGSFDSRTVVMEGTTHLPNGLAPKMDDAQAGDRCPTTDVIMSQSLGGRGGCDAAFGVGRVCLGCFSSGHVELYPKSYRDGVMRIHWN